MTNSMVMSRHVKPRTHYRVRVGTKTYMKMTAIIALVVAMMTSIMVFSATYYVFNKKMNELTLWYNTQMAYQDNQWRAHISDIQASYAQAAEVQAEELNTTQLQLTYTQSLLETIDTENSADFNLLQKYWYIFRDAPADSGLSVEVIQFADDQCKKWDINPHWMWSIYWVESKYHTNIDNTAGSGARGLGQVMPSTGKYMWETVLGHGAGTFSTDMLYNPTVNIEITVGLIGQYIQKGCTMVEALDHYSGGSGSSYYNKVVNSAASRGIILNESNIHYND